MNGRMKRTLAAGLLLGGLGLAGFFVAQFVMAQVGGSDAVPEDLLGATDHTHLSLCVDGAGGLAVSDRDVDMIRLALTDTLAAVADLSPEYRDASVTLGCPRPVALTGKQLDSHDRFSSLDLPVRYVRPPEVPSGHIAFVYFVPPEAYQESFGGEAYAISVEERQCKGDACYPVTEGLYLTRSVELGALHRALLSVLALVPPMPDPTEYSQACLEVTPEQWCQAFDYCSVVPADPFCTADSEACRLGTPGLLCARYKDCAVAQPDPSCEDFWRESGLEPPR